MPLKNSLSWLILCGLYLLNSAAKAQQADFIQYLFQFNEQGQVSNGVFARAAPRIEDLELAKDQLGNPSSVLSYLIQKAPYLKRNFVLVHHSQSQQASSLEFPRIILFDGGMAYAFSEHPAQKKERVEVLQTDPVSHQVSLHEITFAQGQARIEKNPSSCIACHGQPAKPLWNPYDFWPNTFASAIGRIGTLQEETSYQKIFTKASLSPLLGQLTLPQQLDLETENVTAFTQYITQINLARWIEQNIAPQGDLGGYAKPLIAALACTQDYSTFPAVSKVELLYSFFRQEELDGATELYKNLLMDTQKSRDFFKQTLSRTLIEIFPEPQFITNVDSYRLQAE
ncbi:MAG: hypothetical protein COT73_12740, partial [Bdellovibrio sp. CG10_big_fil_rev_8_21_14_0_10_47_8]